MSGWVERIKEERRRALNRREIELAIREVKGNEPPDVRRALGPRKPSAPNSPDRLGASNAP